jgi:hypothetical protein
MLMNARYIVPKRPPRKSRRSWLLLAAFLLHAFPVSADYIIHVQNPWGDVEERKDTLYMIGNAVAGYFPGTKMVNEGGGWFYFIYPPTEKYQANRFHLVSYIPTINSPTANSLRYPATISYSVDSLFAQFSPRTTEIWIYIDDPSKPAQVLDHPKNGKVIYLFNPWPDNSPQIIIGGRNPMRMAMRKDICGWYVFYFAAPVDSLGGVQFTDYFHTQRYTSMGLKAGDPIDLRPFLNGADTVYILPQPFPVGAPVMSAKFPGKTGECGFRKVSGIFRDWRLDNISFFNNPSGMNGGGSKNMVQNQLTGPDYKPKKTTDKSVSTLYADSLNTWFRTYKFANGKDNDTCIDLLLEKDDDGRWTASTTRTT